MKIVIQIVACLALIPWIGIAMFSPMALGSVDAFNDRGMLTQTAVFFGYPILVGVLFWALDWSLLGMPPRTVLLFCSLPPLGLLLLFGIPQAYFNHLRGVKPYGYTVKDRSVYMHGSRIDGADPTTFEAFPQSDHEYAHDATHVYFETRRIDGADPGSFAPLTDGDIRGFWKDRSAVYLHGRRIEADGASFQQLSPFYARDRERVFFDGTWLRDVDPATFEVLKDGGYARDRSGFLLFDRRVFVGADLASFELIEETRYARDARRVYRAPRGRHDAGEIIEGADPATFTPLEGGEYAKDAAHVFYDGESGVHVIEGADAASFEVTRYDSATGSDARDRSRRYREGKPR